MYIKWAWYIESMYPGSTPHSLGIGPYASDRRVSFCLVLSSWVLCGVSAGRERESVFDCPLCGK